MTTVATEFGGSNNNNKKNTSSKTSQDSSKRYIIIIQNISTAGRLFGRRLGNNSSATHHLQNTHLHAHSRVIRFVVRGFVVFAVDWIGQREFSNHCIGTAAALALVGAQTRSRCATVSSFVSSLSFSITFE